MEDDEEIQSYASGGTGSPVSPRPNGRITVTVAAVPSSSQNTLALAVPMQHQPRQPRPSSGGGGREDCWSEGATGVLIDAWGERYLELSRGNLKQKHWKDVADIVSGREDYTKTPKTDIQCKNRIDTVKKKYKVEKAKIATGGGPSKWPFFERLDQLIGPSSKLNSSVASGASPSGIVPYSGSQRVVPMGIPMGVRSAPPFRQQQEKFSPQQLLQKQKQQFRKRPPPPPPPVLDSDEDSEPEEGSPDTADDDFPPETYERKRPRRNQMNLGGGVRPGGPGINRGRDGGADKAGVGDNWGNSLRELTRAILKFGEAYEQAESSKLQQLVDMEKQRMKFAKEMELQRMQFFMKTQLELSQLKTSSSRRRVANNNHRHHSSNNINATTHSNTHHSDSSN